jgi:hypothetical protein
MPTAPRPPSPPVRAMARSGCAPAGGSQSWDVERPPPLTRISPGPARDHHSARVRGRVLKSASTVHPGSCRSPTGGAPNPPAVEPLPKKRTSSVVSLPCGHAPLKLIGVLLQFDQNRPAFWRLDAISSRSTPLGSNPTIEGARLLARRMIPRKIGVKFFHPKVQPQSECGLEHSAKSSTLAISICRQ